MRTRKSIKNDCDTLWSEVVRSVGYCEKCEKDNVRLEAHHVYPRRNHRLRFEPRNGVALCHWCHRYWAHHSAIEFTDWFRDYRSEDAEYLAEENRKGLVNLTTDYYRDWEAHLLSMR